MGFQIVSETSQQVVIPLQYINAFKTNGHFSTIEPLDPFPQLTLAVLEGQTPFWGSTNTEPVHQYVETKLDQNLGKVGKADGHPCR